MYTFHPPGPAPNPPDADSGTAPNPPDADSGSALKRRKRRGCGRVPAFLYDWVGLLVIRPTMFCAVSLALGMYAVKPFFPDCDPPPLLVKLVTAVAMGTFTDHRCCHAHSKYSLQLRWVC